jgi:hypothetical protein
MSEYLGIFPVMNAAGKQDSESKQSKNRQKQGKWLLILISVALKFALIKKLTCAQDGTLNSTEL